MALACILIAVRTLAVGWARGRVSHLRRAGVAALVLSATAIWKVRFGAEIGIPLLLETSALVAFVYILFQSDRRGDRRERRTRNVPPPTSRPSRWHGPARFLVGGPLGFVAAMGIAIVIATRGPGAEQTRLIVAGLVIPTLWAVAIGWIAADRRLAVQAVALGAIGMLGFGITFLAGA